MVRLVKGAYWDSRDQARAGRGLAGYPVFTRKAHTDVSLPRLRAQAAGARRDAVYPQFATHNAQTLAAVHRMAGRLEPRPVRVPVPARHGRAALRRRCVGRSDRLGRPCRIYAPVGTHETLLAYLVRRLLENGANTSFVNRIADPRVPIEELVADPVRDRVRTRPTSGPIGSPHPRIPAAAARSVGAVRAATRAAWTSTDDGRALRALAPALAQSARARVARAAPHRSAQRCRRRGACRCAIRPTDDDLVGP